MLLSCTESCIVLHFNAEIERPGDLDILAPDPQRRIRRTAFREGIHHDFR